MYYNVSARKHGERIAFQDTDVVGEKELQAAIAHFQALSDANGEPYRLSIKPREHFIDIEPRGEEYGQGLAVHSKVEARERVKSVVEQDREERDGKPPRTDESPSVCEILNRGD